MHSLPFNNLKTALLKDQWQVRRQWRKLQHSSPDKQEQQQSVLQQTLDESNLLRELREQNVPKISFPEILPITEYVDTIVEALEHHQVLVIAGETGSGKTTQIPKMCLKAGRGIFGKIACTQPRRIAATSIAQQLSKELQSPLGDAVGYKIRFDEKISDQTYIQFMTDGVLLAETQTDRFLNTYDTLIIDEAHERSLNIDFLLGYLKSLLKKRRDLKLLITSANLDTERFSKAFNNAPILEVSGRTYPVDVKYQPIPDDGDWTMEDWTVHQLRHLLQHTHDGDVLSFLSGEREIREVLDRLQSDNALSKQKIRFLPLYGRLPHKQQQQIFAPSAERKVILATNVAETSLTIPGIRYVVDTGLARISRYSSKHQTQHLQVEPISQSSANQRKGRAGRVQAGVCIRLYDQESLENRSEFTDPEILRSSLAGVLLKMLDLKFGEVEQFPFIDAPSKTAIREGMKLLQELDAIDSKKRLTPIGRQMARLPVEPRVARMLIAAQQYDALKEVLVIASGISVQDPREYPPDQEAHARQAHQSFVNAGSDFLTLLNLWNSYHEEWEALKTQNKMRKFCKAHFLSYVRMREWRDIFQQLKDILQEFRGFRVSDTDAEPENIHKAVLAGHLRNIGHQSHKNHYKVPGNREALIFPGSAVYHKGTEWILAGAFVETSRLFARLVANMDVEWLEEVGKAHCKYSYFEPFFDTKSQRVLAYEKVTLYGLTLVPRRLTAYGKANPKDATQLFIRHALVEGELRTHWDFLRHNLDLQYKVQQHGAKLRRNYDYEVEQAAQAFYESHLYNVFSVHDLNQKMKKWVHQKNPKCLHMEEADLMTDLMQEANTQEYPDAWQLGEHQLPLNYSTATTTAGLSISVTPDLLKYIDDSMLDWLVPGHREERVYFMLKHLPKSYRKQLIPIAETAKTIAQHLEPTHSKFTDALGHYIYQNYQVVIPLDAWNTEELPAHLKVELQVSDPKKSKKVLSKGTDVQAVLSEAQNVMGQKVQKALTSEVGEWVSVEKEWTVGPLTTWSFEVLPPQIEVFQTHGIPVYGYPGLKETEHGIQRTLFRNPQQAQQATFPALQHLLFENMGTDMKWFHKDLKQLNPFREVYKPFGSMEQLKKGIEQQVKHYLFEGGWIENRLQFDARLEQAKQRLRGLFPQLMESLNKLFVAYESARKCAYQYLHAPSYQMYYEQVQDHFQQLLPPNFAAEIPYAQLQHYPRYFQSIEKRMERLVNDTQKDERKWEQVEPYVAQMQHHWSQIKPGVAPSEKHQQLRWMVEEFRVSIFAPELKTAFPVSAKRLDGILEELANG